MHGRSPDSRVFELSAFPEYPSELQWLNGKLSPLTVAGAVEAQVTAPFLIPVSPLKQHRLRDTMHLRVSEAGGRYVKQISVV